MHHPIPRRWPWSWLRGPRCHCGADRWRDCLRDAVRDRIAPPPYVEPQLPRDSMWGDDPGSRPGRHY